VVRQGGQQALQKQARCSMDAALRVGSNCSSVLRGGNALTCHPPPLLTAGEDQLLGDGVVNVGRQPLLHVPHLMAFLAGK
jgi:hypothetical protein